MATFYQKQGEGRKIGVKAGTTFTDMTAPDNQARG
jgi:hypothetical protein